MPGTVGLGAEGGFRKPEDNNSGGGTLDLPDLGRDISNWTGNVGRAAKGGLEDIVHANYKKDSGNWAGDLEQWGTDAANIARGGFNQADWWAKRNLSETGLDNSWGDALGTMNTAGKILNGIYSYAGGPTFNIGNMQVGQSGPTINWQDTLNNLDTGIAHELTNEVRSVGRDIFEGGKPTGPGHWVTKYSTAGTATPGGEIDKHQTSQRVWVPDQKSPDFWHQAAHGAMSAVQAAFDTPQHMYRAAVLAYQKYGWDGVTAVLAPAVAGAAAGAMVGNPEVGAVAADTAGATAASSAADVATADATASTAEGAAASVAQEAPAVGPTVAQEQAMRPVTSAAERFMNSPIGRASKLVGYPVKTVNQAMTSPVLAGAQIPDYAYHFSNGPMGDIWRQAQHAHGDLTTIGRGLSQWVYGKPDTWLSGTTDAIATLISTPYEFGRALHLSETGARVLTVADSTAVDTAFNKSAGYRRALTQILDMAHGGSGKAVQENLAGAIARSMPSLEPIAADLAKAAAKDGATEYSLSRRIGEMADASRMTQTTNLPTLGLYGISKMKARLSDSFVPSWLSRTFGQSPMALDDLKQIMTTRSIRLGEPNAGFKLGELLQQTGMKSGDITRLVNHLVTTRDLTEWESAIKSALKENFYQRIDRRFISALGMNSEEFAKAFREGNLTDEQVAELDSKLRQPEAASVYMKLRKAISNKVDELVGDSKAGKDGALFGYDGYGVDLSKLDRGGTAAITENQRGELHLPNFQQIDKELGDFFKQMGRVNSPEARFGDMISRSSARTEELLNEYVNDRWFKPLALLTPGWAFRVSLSELMLNTARLGPGNILAGALTRGMVKRQREAFYLADQSANKTIRELEGRASSLEKNIADEATKETPNLGAVQRWQEEHAALRRHIDWLHSPAGTPEPTVGNAKQADQKIEDLVNDPTTEIKPFVDYTKSPNAPKLPETARPDHEQIPDATYYHGTARRLPADGPSSLEDGVETSGISNIATDGYYVTDSKKVASEYPKKGGDQAKWDDKIAARDWKDSLERAKDRTERELRNRLRSQIEWEKTYGTGTDGHLLNITPEQVDNASKDELINMLYPEPKSTFNPTVYGHEWGGEKPPNLIDLEKPFTGDAKDTVIKFLEDSKQSPLVHSTEAYDEVIAKISSGEIKGRDAVTEVRRLIGNDVADMNGAKWEADEAYRDFTFALQDAGFDGVSMAGGQIIGKTPHTATVFFDPSKLNVVHATLMNERKVVRPSSPFTPHDIGVAKQPERVGPEPMVALVPPETVQHFLESKGYKLNKTEIGNLTALAHGIAIGTRQAMLTAIGKEEFVKNAAYLMYRHGGYLPGAVDSVHKSWLDHVDLSGDYVEEVKTKRAYDEAGLPVPKRDRKGNLKTKLVLMSPTEFAGTSFGQHRYFEGWFYGANTLAGSEYLGRPLAKAYLDLLGKGLQGNDLHIAAVNEATKIINDLPENVRLTMVRHLVPGAGHNEPVSSWAETLTSRLEGVASKPIRQGKLTEEEITNGIDNRDVTYQPHVELLRDISNNFLPSHVNNFYEEYAFFPDGAARGKDYMPETVASRTPQLYSKSDFISRLSTYGHSKVLGPMVNYLTRQPTYIAEFIMERKNLEEKVAKGILTPDQADIVAETAATRRMTRYIHNPEDKTRFEQTMSVYAPFYFAQNQAWRRMGRLFAENPGAFMQYLTVMLGVQDWVTKVTNQNGISMYTLPGLAMYGLPFTASLSSLQTMDPFSPTPDMGQGTNKTQTILDLIAPKFGPVVTVPAKLVNYFLPSTTHGQGAWLSRQLEGNIAMGETASQFFYQSAIPNSLIRNLVELPVGYAESSRTGGTALDFMDNAYFQAVSESIRYTVQAESKQYWDFLNSKGVHDQNGNSLSPYEKSVAFYEWQAQHWNPNTMTGQHSLQYLLDSSRQKAGILWMAKILGGFVSPVTINVGNANMDMVNKLQKMTASKKFGGNYLKAVDAFTKEYPWATIDTLAKSTSTYGGYAPETKTYYNWLGEHEYLATSAPLAAPAFAPDSGKDTKYFQPAHNLLLQLGLRQRETPWQFLDSFMISTGNSFYYNWIKPQYEQYRTQDKSAAYKWRQSMMTWYGTNYNTTWLASYNEGLSTIRKQQTLTQATEVLADPQKYGVTIDPQNKAVLSLLMQQIQGGNGKPGAYQELQTEIKSGKLNSVDASTAWQNWLDGWIKKYPESKQAIMTLFYNLG